MHHCSLNVAGFWILLGIMFPKIDSLMCFLLGPDKRDISSLVFVFIVTESLMRGSKTWKDLKFYQYLVDCISLYLRGVVPSFKSIPVNVLKADSCPRNFKIFLPCWYILITAGPHYL